MNEDILKQLEDLRTQIHHHNQLYYEEDAPKISDYAYDRMLRDLASLESQYPELITPNSPTQRVGGKALDFFEKSTHLVPMQSLADIFHQNELLDFHRRVTEQLNRTDISYVVERKIDGLSVALEYENGIFVKGATRGDGLVGEDVTQNLKTIPSIPLALPKAPSYLVVRGEVFISKANFEKVNQEQAKKQLPLFANPRNAAAGSLRQLDPKIAASRKLDLFIFNVQSIDGESFETHSDSLKYLKECGFQVIPRYKICESIDEVWEEVEHIGAIRPMLPFDIDGAVVKVNHLRFRDQLGSTSKTPRWAVAFKYPAEQKSTFIREILINVGRTGVLTPIASLEPVHVAGSTLSSASLHNIDYIHQKDIRVGDTVFIQKAGDIIPEIVSVDFSKRTKDSLPFQMPAHCPICASEVIRDAEESAHRCINSLCPAQVYRSILHFVSRDAMNIEGLGSAVIQTFIDNKFIETVQDLYSLHSKKEQLIALDGFGEKSVTNLLNAIEKSKTNDLHRLIFGFGIRYIGQKAAKTLSLHFKNLSAIENASFETLMQIDGFGETMASSIVDFFSKKETHMLIQALMLANINTHCISFQETIDERLNGQIFVITGTLTTYSRKQVEDLITQHGGKISGSVSKKTNYLLAGENAGSKLEKAKNLQVPIIDEAMLQEILQTNSS